MVIAKVVLTELDIHKNSDSRRLRDGARRLRRVLEDFYADEPTGVRPGVWLSFRLAHPERILAQTSLSAEQKADVLVASMIAFREEHPDRDLLLVSDDADPRFTARAFGIGVPEPPESLRLPDTPTEQERELVEARREIDRLRSARPKLEVRFANVPKGVPLVVDLERPAELTVEAVNALVHKEREERTLLTGSAIFMHLTAAQLAKYNSELEKYLERYRQYLPEQWEFREARKRSFAVHLEVWNSGTAPANDIDAHLHFPDGFSMKQADSDQDGEEEPEAPEAPSVPMSPLEEVMEGMRSIQHYDLRPITEFRPYTRDLVRGLDPRQLRIQRSESYDLTATIKRVKQGRRFAFNPLQLQFDSDDSVANFTIHYRLQPIELPVAVEDDLHVVVRR